MLFGYSVYASIVFVALDAIGEEARFRRAFELLRNCEERLLFEVQWKFDEKSLSYAKNI